MNLREISNVGMSIRCFLCLVFGFIVFFCFFWWLYVVCGIGIVGVEVELYFVVVFLFFYFYVFFLIFFYVVNVFGG